MNRPDTHRDSGFTLTEVIVTVVLTGILASVIAAAVIVVLRSEDGVARTVGESHDLQQAVNYFPDDVGVAPTDQSAYRTTGAPSCGSGGHVLSIDYPSGDSVSYLTVETGSVLRLDRVECRSGVTTAETNVADLLDRESPSPASAALTVTDGQVAAVTLQLVRAGGRATEVVAIPRASEELADAYTVGGACSSTDPLEETMGFLTFVEGAATLSGSTQVYKAIGIGGVLTFHGAQVASHGGNDTYRPASVGIYADSVDWANSSGQLVVNGSPNGHVVLTGEVEGVDITTKKNGSITYIRQLGSTGQPEIKAQQGQLKQPNPGHTVAFPAAFTELRACSEAMAQLPNGCDGCAAHVVPLHVNSSSTTRIEYAGTGDLKLDLTPGVTNVLNIGERRLRAIGAVTPAYLDVDPRQVDSLVINVIDDDPSNDTVSPDGEPVSVVRLDQPLRFQNHTTKVLWNFAGIDRVELPNGIWGTVFAPFGHASVGNNVQGNLVASTVEVTGGVINEARSFEGVVRWD